MTMTSSESPKSISNDEYEQFKKWQKDRPARVLSDVQKGNIQGQIPQTDVNVSDAGQQEAPQVLPQQTPRRMESHNADGVEGINKGDLTGTPEPEQLKCGECLELLDGPVETCPKCGTELDWETE